MYTCVMSVYDPQAESMEDVCSKIMYLYTHHVHVWKCASGYT